MKNITLILSLVLFITNGYSQCQVKTIHRSDSVTVKYLNPEMVGKGTGCELGVSISSTDTLYTFNTTVLYYGAALKSIGTLMIQLSDNNSLNLTLHTSQLATMNNQNVSIAVYYLSKQDVEKLKKTTIKRIIFKNATGTNNIITVTKNSNVASRHIKCINQ